MQYKLKILLVFQISDRLFLLLFFYYAHESS